MLPSLRHLIFCPKLSDFMWHRTASLTAPAEGPLVCACRFRRLNLQRSGRDLLAAQQLDYLMGKRRERNSWRSLARVIYRTITFTSELWVEPKLPARINTRDKLPFERIGLVVALWVFTAT